MKKQLSEAEIKRHVDYVVATMSFEGFVMTENEKKSLETVIRGENTVENELEKLKLAHGWR